MSNLTSHNIFLDFSPAINFVIFTAMFVNAGTSGLFDLLATNMHNGQTANMKEFTVHAHLLLILRVL